MASEEIILDDIRVEPCPSDIKREEEVEPPVIIPHPVISQISTSSSYSPLSCCFSMALIATLWLLLFLTSLAALGLFIYELRIYSRINYFTLSAATVGISFSMVVAFVALFVTQRDKLQTLIIDDIGEIDTFMPSPSQNKPFSWLKQIRLCNKK